MSDQVLAAHGLGMTFPGVTALADFDFDLREGEVHCLLGENGAGKSTFINILSGVLPNYTGSVEVRGAPVRITHPADAKALGIGTIHQEFNLVPAMTVAENVMLGNEPQRGAFVDRAAARDKVLATLEDLQVDISPDAPVRSLSTAQQQMIEIAKALALAPSMLILDEPTASISDRDVGELFRIIRLLKERGTSFIYISHRLRELGQIGDRVTVMRDGRQIATLPIEEADKQDTIKMMVGRAVVEQKLRTDYSPEDNDLLLSVRHANWAPKLRDVSFDLHRGEILGFAGLVGAGRTELMKTVFGAYRNASCEVVLGGKAIAVHSPRDAVRAGISYLSEDRKSEGLVLSRSVEDNIVLPNLPDVSHGPFVDGAAQRSAAEKFVKLLRIATPDIRRRARLLSGGNQQKVVIAKWLHRDCDILIFDEPTRGIDVGSRAEIHHLIVSLAKQGKSIVVVSSDLPEVINLCDRIIVMSHGSIAGTLDNRSGVEQHVIMDLMLSDD